MGQQEMLPREMNRKRKLRSRDQLVLDSDDELLVEFAAVPAFRSKIDPRRLAKDSYMALSREADARHIAEKRSPATEPGAG